ncbi:UNVERIFIED_CONTAM: putative aquaporin NIP-type [Sesamum radiatum]|uniref:Aquaporin NIP-type n=1 Tax=Sesamum radiatum TaxID=300843 RepID=A0AAW2P5W8_SESRA
MASKVEGIAEEEEEIARLESGVAACNATSQSRHIKGFCASSAVVTTAQKVYKFYSCLFFCVLVLKMRCTSWKVAAELIGTYFVIFAGCGSVAVNKLYGGTVTFPGICVTWGLIVMVMVYTVGHVSGAHFNPAVTLAFAIFRRFSWKEVPLYIIAQLMGSILASCTLALMFDITKEAYFGTLPVGSNGQSLAIEIVISFLLMFVISGTCTDSRAVGELGGLAVGMTIMLNVFVAGPISGASMNPARSIGPAIVKQEYRGLWVYIVGPVVGIVGGGFVYNLIRFTNKPISELGRSGSFLRTKSKDDST